MICKCINSDIIIDKIDIKNFINKNNINKLYIIDRKLIIKYKNII
jgi:hypothetical protein